MLEIDPSGQALSKKLVSDSPFWWRICGCLYSHKCRVVFERVLWQRDPALVESCWRDLGVDEHFRLVVNDLIAENFSWRRSLFTPKDECYILFGFWQRGITDGMEFVSFVIALDSILGFDIPVELMDKLPSMTYGEFLQALTVLADSEEPEIVPTSRPSCGRWIRFLVWIVQTLYFWLCRQ